MRWRVPAPFNRLLMPDGRNVAAKAMPESLIVAENYDCSTATTEAAKGARRLALG